jgi:NDP-sugar pyrophosphorylase family protein
MSACLSDVAAIIMAGGKSSRFGALGQLLPKCLFPVLPDQTLLTRLADQMRLAGITQAAVCCSPDNAALIKPFLDGYRATSNQSGVDLKAISCPNSRGGPLPALQEALQSVSARWYLMCLADIFFDQAPFGAFASQLEDNKPFDGCLLTGTDLTSRNGCGTGAVACEGPVVRAISYRPFGPAQSIAGPSRRWSGSFFFRDKLVSDLSEHLGEYQQAPLENWVQGLLDRGAQCRWLEAGPFVNVNSVPDYQFLVNRPGDVNHD